MLLDPPFAFASRQVRLNGTDASWDPLVWVAASADEPLRNKTARGIRREITANETTGN